MADIDPRRVYDHTVGWVHELMAQVVHSELKQVTPCPDFTVKALMGHLIGTAERGLATAEGRPSRPIPHVITEVPDDELASRYGVFRGHLRTAWSQLDPEQQVQAPWGTTTANRAAWGFATETLVHGWDRTGSATSAEGGTRQTVSLPPSAVAQSGTACDTRKDLRRATSATCPTCHKRFRNRDVGRESADRRFRAP